MRMCLKAPHYLDNDCNGYKYHKAKGEERGYLESMVHKTCYAVSPDVPFLSLCTMSLIAPDSSSKSN